MALGEIIIKAAVPGAGQGTAPLTRWVDLSRDIAGVDASVTTGSAKDNKPPFCAIDGPLIDTTSATGNLEANVAQGSPCFFHAHTDATILSIKFLRELSIIEVQIDGVKTKAADIQHIDIKTIKSDGTTVVLCGSTGGTIGTGSYAGYTGLPSVVVPCVARTKEIRLSHGSSFSGSDGGMQVSEVIPRVLLEGGFSSKLSETIASKGTNFISGGVLVAHGPKVDNGNWISNQEDMGAVNNTGRGRVNTFLHFV